MFGFLQEPEPSVSDIIDDDEPDESEPPPPQDDVKLGILQDIEECFGIFDPTNTGTMDIKYLEKSFTCLGIILTPFEMEDEKENLNKNGAVIYEDFHAYTLAKLTETDPFERVKEAFRVFDPEREGMVPTERFKKWMMTLGDPITDKEVKELIKIGDPAKKGFIAYDDLAAVIVK